MGSSPFMLTAVSSVCYECSLLLTVQVSPYSWFGFTNITKFRPMLNAHGVQVEILPFFLGGARDGVGNPWTPVPQAKVSFANQDTTMTGKILGLNIVPPEVFPISSLFVSSPLLHRNKTGLIVTAGSGLNMGQNPLSRGQI